jgi:hypothetical protein
MIAEWNVLSLKILQNPKHQSEYIEFPVFPQKCSPLVSISGDKHERLDTEPALFSIITHAAHETFAYNKLQDNL